MSTSEEVLINTILAGTREFVANATAEAAAVGEIGEAAELTGRKFERAGKRGFLMNQALFTMRRVAYASTLALLGVGAAGLKMGFDFDSSMQRASVAFKGFLGSEQAVSSELRYLYRLAAYTPLRFNDITNAARLMMGFGFDTQTTNRTLSNMIDMLTAMGVDSPASIKRVSIALGHMMNVGHVTGAVLYQLARDNIPVYQILQKQLGLTADQLHNIGKMGIPAQVVLDAINRGIEADPRYHGAARRLALTTFHGLFTTLQDFAAQFFGTVEKPIFKRAQTTLQHLVTGLQDVSDVAQRTNGNMEAIARTLGGEKLVLFWQQLRGALQDFWAVFSGVISGVAHSTFVWGTVFVILTLVHGALHILGFNAYQLGQAIGFLLPVWIGWITYLKISAFWTFLNADAEFLFTKATRELTFAQFLAAVAVGRYNIMARIGYGLTRVFVFWEVMLAAASEKIAFRMRLASAAVVIWNVAATAGAGITAGLTATIEALTTAIYAIPIVGWILLAITLLVTLYLKWKAFHDAVNGFVSFMYNHPLVAFFVSVIGPLIVMVRIIVEIVQHLQDLVRWAKDAAHWVGKIPGMGGGGGLFDGAMNVAGWATGITPGMKLGGWLLNQFPGQAEGGRTVRAGLSWVGEDGPELLHMPVGAQVAPLGSNFDWGGDLSKMITVIVKPFDINIDGHKVATVMSGAVADAGARL